MSDDVRSLSVIFAEVLADWPKARDESHPAGAYAVPLSGLDSIDDRYYMDNARGLVRYFLANAGGWRGETAKRIKDELKKML